MIKKLIPILFIILFGSVLSIYLYASSDNIKVNKIVKNMPEYNDEEFKKSFIKYCNTFNEKTILLYMDRMFDILSKSATEEEVYNFVNSCFQKNNTKLLYDKIVEDKYSILIRKYYSWFFNNIHTNFDEEYFLNSGKLGLFYDKINKEDVKAYINIITSNDYIITPASYKNLSMLQNKIDEKDMKVISYKLEKDIIKYTEKVFSEIQNSYMKKFNNIGLNDEEILDFIYKYYTPDIDYDFLLELMRVYYYINLKDDYKELANSIMKYISLKTGYNDETSVLVYGSNKKYIDKYIFKDADDVYEYFLMNSSLYMHLEDAAYLKYAYAGSKPLKIKGVLTLSNINSKESEDTDYSLNDYLPKSFVSYDNSVKLNKISILPKKYTYSGNIDSKFLEKDLFSEINCDAEIIIGMDSKIYLTILSGINNIRMYIDEVKINKIVSSQKYEDDDSYPVYIIIKQ